MSALSDKADALWQKLICQMWQGRCAYCRVMWNVSAHHITKRRFHATRWALENGIALCCVHHAWAEANDKKFLSWLQLAYPWIYEWHAKNTNPPIVRFANHNIKDIIAQLQRALERL